MSSCVLDASAVLALLHKEPGADTVAEKLPNAAISTVRILPSFAENSGGPLVASKTPTPLISVATKSLAPAASKASPCAS